MLSTSDRALITDIRVTNAPLLSTGLQLVRSTQVTYNVAGQGPFTDAFNAVDYTPENVDAAWATQIEKLRALGIIAAAQ